MGTKNYGKGKEMKILSYAEADRLIDKLISITGGKLDYPSRAKIANIRKKQEQCVALSSFDKDVLLACISRSDSKEEVKQYETLTYNT